MGGREEAVVLIAIQLPTPATPNFRSQPVNPNVGRQECNEH